MTTINDMELMHKMRKFMRQTRMELAGRGMHPHGCHGHHGHKHHGSEDSYIRLCGAPDDRPPMPPHGPDHRDHHGPEHCDHHGPEHHGPHGCHGHGPHGKRPPLSRERLLIIISKYPEGVRQKTIAEEVGINQSSASELINKLEATGYIKRNVDPSDKRATLLTLTEKGQARAAEVEDERAAMFEGIFSKLSDEEKQTLSDLLDKLLA